MTAENIIQQLNGANYCLWVGAGISSYLASNTGFKVPNWRELVELMEQKAEIHSPMFSATLPERLQVALRKLNNYQFNEVIRETILLQLARAFIGHVENNPGVIPITFQNVAKLGVFANPIVNFNFETLSSRILASVGGEFSIKTYGRKELGDNWSAHIGTHRGQRFRRHIYHPHGSIETYGISVLTEKDYRKLNYSLAYQLATHSAFDDVLMIVGMSLDDQYLREQISNFRSEIREIYWFQEKQEITEEVRKWSWKHEIEIIELENWNSFWNSISNNIEIDRHELNEAWLELIHYCINVINQSYLAEKHLKQFRKKNTPWIEVIRWKNFFAQRGIPFSELLDSSPVIGEEQIKEIIAKAQPQFISNR